MNKPPLISIVIPLFNEVDTIPRLVAAVGAALETYPDSKHQVGFELILVDDGSRDGSRQALGKLQAEIPWLKCLSLIRNYGQSTALQAGFDAAQGQYIVTLDGDLQNDPRDIPALIETFKGQQGIAQSAEVVYVQVVGSYNDLMEPQSKAVERALALSQQLDRTYPDLFKSAATTFSTTKAIPANQVVVRVIFAEKILITK